MSTTPTSRTEIPHYNGPLAVVHAEIYEGHLIEVGFRSSGSNGRSSWGESYLAYLDERSYAGSARPTLDKAIATARGWVDKMIADDALRPTCEKVRMVIPRTVARSVPSEDTFDSLDEIEVGMNVWGRSRGNVRSMIVEKVGRTKATCAYVTEVGGIVTRKTFGPNELAPRLARA